MAQAEESPKVEQMLRVVRKRREEPRSAWGVIKKSIAGIFKTKSSREDTREASKSMDEDPFAYNYESYDAIVPPFDLYQLATMPEECGELTPSIDAMSVNIEKLGHRIVPRPNVHNLNEEIPKEIKDQIAIVENFFANCVIDQEQQSFEELRSRLRKDLETTGNAYVEVIPKLNSPTEPAGLKHLPSWTMRLRKLDEEYTTYDVPRGVKSGDGTWRIVFMRDTKKFRRFIQIRESGAKAVFFKEWNDPRSVNCETGYVDDNIPEEKLAHEVIHLKLYSSRSPYGLPRWIGRLFAIKGSRGAEEINYVTLDNNQMPGMALLATNVAVTDGSLDRMKEYIEERIQGNKNYSTILLIEAEPVGEGMRDPSSMKLELKPLTEYQHTDAMFKDYITMNDDMVRRSFRLPPVYVGKAVDYNKATAESSKRLAEEQIFMPERRAVDLMWTNTIIMRLGIASVFFKSNTANVTDNFELTQLLATAERSGGLTPRTSTTIVEDVLSMELPEPPANIKPDQPFSMTMLEKEYELQGQLQAISAPGIEKHKMAEDISDVRDFLSRVLQRDAVDEFLNDEERSVFQRAIS